MKEENNVEENLITEEKIKEVNKSSKKNRGFNTGIEALKNKINEKESNISNNSSIVNNVINKIFENEEFFVYDDLLMNICEQMNIINTDKEKINQIKKEIDENCLLINKNIAFWIKKVK